MNNKSSKSKKLETIKRKKAALAKNALESSGQLIIYQTEDGKTKIDVRFEDETVWLTQQQMAELFQTTQQNVSLHISNIYEESELFAQSTHKKYLSVQTEGTLCPKKSARRPAGRFKFLPRLTMTHSSQRNAH
jgi:hypothetical protein